MKKGQQDPKWHLGVGKGERDAKGRRQDTKRGRRGWKKRCQEMTKGHRDPKVTRDGGVAACRRMAPLGMELWQSPELPAGRGRAQRMAKRNPQLPQSRGERRCPHPKTFWVTLRRRRSPGRSAKRSLPGGCPQKWVGLLVLSPDVRGWNCLVTRANERGTEQCLVPEKEPWLFLLSSARSEPLFLWPFPTSGIFLPFGSSPWDFHPISSRVSSLSAFPRALLASVTFQEQKIRGGLSPYAAPK